MPRLFDRSPFPAQPSEVVRRHERIRLRADQIVLWVSLTLQRERNAKPSIVPFPAILDTGFNFTFSIHERHLAEWSGLRLDTLVDLGTIRDRGQTVP